MNPNPLSDTIAFLLQPGWTTAIFWLLMVGSIAIAAYAYDTIPGQRSLAHLGNWGFRLLIGAMWWQQSLWKLPPYYTDHPEQPFGDTGLAYWMKLMGQHAAILCRPTSSTMSCCRIFTGSRRSSMASKS